MATPRYTGCVYLATNTVNGRCYVGQTSGTFQKRQSAHLSSARMGLYGGFHAAIRKYGEQAFAWEVIFYAFDHKSLLSAEVAIIAEMRASGANLYNLTDGGEGQVGFKHSPETIAKMRQRIVTEEMRQASSLANKGKILPPETRAKISEGLRGRPVSPESRAKMSASHKGQGLGKKQSEEHRRKCALARTGRVVSEETRAKLRAANFGKRPSPETIAKSQAARTGRKLSAEHCKRLSEAQRLRWAKLKEAKTA